jgi:hypothetical protein
MRRQPGVGRGSPSVRMLGLLQVLQIHLHLKGAAFVLFHA